MASSTGGITATSSPSADTLSVDTPSAITPTRANAPAVTSRGEEPKPCHLLDMPGEIKNEIYRLVVIDSAYNHRIKIRASGFERSALLETCKEIHRDAMKIFLLENCFYLVTANYKSDFLKRFEDLCSKHLRYFNTPYKKITINLKLEHWISWRLAIGEYEGNEVWDNVMTWLHRFHAGEIRSVVKVAPQLV